MIDLKGLVMQLVSRNPQVANNPNAQEFINVIQSGDNARGEQIAQNLCNTYGISKEQAIAQAKKFFGIY